MNKIITFLFGCVALTSVAQNRSVENQKQRNQLYEDFRQKEIQDSLRAAQLSSTGNVKIIEIDDNSEIIQLVRFEPNGFPVFYANDNEDAAVTVGTNLVVAGATNGYGLTGNGMIIGEWDGGAVRGTHTELTGRITQTDGASSLSDHATHVAGTMVASGAQPTAKGMATAATISAHDFSGDDSEMTTFSATGLISNHSYGRITGWRQLTSGDYQWYGDTTISGTEDYMFGFYSYDARIWDLIANAAPNYLIVKSAGNDRNDYGPPAGIGHEIYYNGNWIPSTASRPEDGGATGYDCISSSGNAKNILTVGAVNDIPNGWSQASDVVMSSFSGWGPTDDGRIKPDIVANGILLYSSGSDTDTDYYSSSGTSMSAPNATGSMALLQEMYNDSNSTFMTASSLKALVIHTANEAGLTGPDFQFGWGLLNVKSAADVIADTTENKIIEATLTNNSTDTYSFYANGSTDVEATIVWNDPAAPLQNAALDPTNIVLVHDLDLRITDATGTVKQPWIVNGAMPSVAATRGDNIKDNVEKVIFENPTSGMYTFTVSHKGSLGGFTGGQDYSIVITGISQPTGPPPVASFSANVTTICSGDSVSFTNTSTNGPNAVEWTFTGGTPNTSTDSIVTVVYPTGGTYDVKLKVTNANGPDSLIQNNYITVNATPVITITPLNDVCVSQAGIQLTQGSPSGGVWTGNGVSNGMFDPMTAGVGTHVLTYTVTNGTCTDSDTASITVVNTPVASFPASSVPVCDNSSAFTIIGGTPLGGVYSGTGVSNNIFDPAVAGLGTHIITYTVTNSTGCSTSATSNIVVVPGTAVSLSPLSDVCEASAIVNLMGGTPVGGYYVGVGVDSATATFDPVIAGPGMHTITYFGSGGLCVSAATTTITVNPLPAVTLSSLPSECLATTSVTLSGGSPAGGTYTGTAVANGVFDPSAAGIGVHWIYYSYTDALTGCSATDSASIDVVNSIQFSLNDTSVCENEPAFMMTDGTPSGGVYSGTGTVGGTVFDPAVAGVGVHQITYTNAVNTCASPGVANYTVVTSPTVTLAAIPNICLNGGLVTLSGGSPLGGTYSGIGVTNNSIDPTVNGAGPVDITYTFTANGCSSSATQTAIIGNGSPEILNLKTSYCVNEGSVVLVGNPTGGTFAGSGISDSLFDPNAAGVGIHNIVYTTTGGCAGATSYSVQVHPKPIIGSITGPIISSQNTIAPYLVNAQNGAFYNWTITGGTIETNSNNQISVKWDTASSGMLEVVMVSQFGCMDTTSLMVSLWPLTVAEIDVQDEVRFYPNPVTEQITFTGKLVQQKEVELLVLDATGKKIYNSKKHLNSGEYLWKVNVSSWSSGTYFFQVSSTGKVMGQGQFLKH